YQESLQTLPEAAEGITTDDALAREHQRLKRSLKVIEARERELGSEIKARLRTSDDDTWTAGGVTYRIAEYDRTSDISAVAAAQIIARELGERYPADIAARIGVAS